MNRRTPRMERPGRFMRMIFVSESEGTKNKLSNLCGRLMKRGR